MRVTITHDELRSHHGTADDEALTRELMAHFARVLPGRSPAYLTLEEFDRVAHWKLRGQYGRTARHFARLTEERVRECTAAMLALDGDDPVEVAVERVKCIGYEGSPYKMHGVHIRVASAVAALTDPARCCVIDFRGWRAVFGDVPCSYTPNQYRVYAATITRLAGELGWGVAETDIAAWAFDAARSASRRPPVCRH